MGIEIERKFLVNETAWRQLKKSAGTWYKQGYILTDPQKTIRIRIAGHEAFITIKGISEGFTRQEFEYAIPKKDAEVLLNNFTVSSVTKTRYKIIHEGKLWEVDEFEADNEGLLLAEIELETEEETFTIPDWIGKEVTNDKRYYNSNLSLTPFKKWNH